MPSPEAINMLRLAVYYYVKKVRRAGFDTCKGFTVSLLSMATLYVTGSSWFKRFMHLPPADSTGASIFRHRRIIKFSIPPTLASQQGRRLRKGLFYLLWLRYSALELILAELINIFQKPNVLITSQRSRRPEELESVPFLFVQKLTL